MRSSLILLFTGSLVEGFVPEITRRCWFRVSTTALFKSALISRERQCMLRIDTHKFIRPTKKDTVEDESGPKATQSHNGELRRMAHGCNSTRTTVNKGSTDENIEHWTEPFAYLPFLSGKAAEVLDDAVAGYCNTFLSFVSDIGDNDLAVELQGSKRIKNGPEVAKKRDERLPMTIQLMDVHKEDKKTEQSVAPSRIAADAVRVRREKACNTKQKQFLATESHATFQREEFLSTLLNLRCNPNPLITNRGSPSPARERQDITASVDEVIAEVVTRSMEGIKPLPLLELGFLADSGGGAWAMPQASLAPGKVGNAIRKRS